MIELFVDTPIELQVIVLYGLIGMVWCIIYDKR